MKHTLTLDLAYLESSQYAGFGSPESRASSPSGRSDQHAELNLTSGLHFSIISSGGKHNITARLPASVRH